MNCPELVRHLWRYLCTNCNERIENHSSAVKDPLVVLKQLEVCTEEEVAEYEASLAYAKDNRSIWLPIGISEEAVSDFVAQYSHAIGSSISSDTFSTLRLRNCFKQCVHGDISEANMRFLSGKDEKRIGKHYVQKRKEDFGIGMLDVLFKNDNCDSIMCAFCEKDLEKYTTDEKEYVNKMCVRIKQCDTIAWHPACFRCATCKELLVDYFYFTIKDAKKSNVDSVYCMRHYGDKKFPRCTDCDELIMSEQYVSTNDEDHHIEHFVCCLCESSLSGARYILKNEKPTCLSCYDIHYANHCVKCGEKISCDDKDLSSDDQHWHEKCFTCADCNSHLIEKPFANKDKCIYCQDCYTERFSARCCACQKIFVSGARKFDYKNKQWHENCFTCNECKNPIGSNSFIPRNNEIVCVPCFEEKYAQKCKKCEKAIRKGGVTHNNMPYHRQCFLCAGCFSELADVKFTTKDNEPYCADCYGEKFAKKCNRCTKPITSIGGCKYVSFENQQWHSDCFTCIKCEISLVGRGFLPTDGNEIVCSECS